MILNSKTSSLHKKGVYSSQQLIGSMVLVFLSMIYVSIMICNAVLTHRYVGVNSFYILGGTLTSPFIFILDNIIAEIFGYKIAQMVILSGFAAQVLFSMLCEIVILSPYPTFFNEQTAYVYLFGPALLRIDFSGFLAYISANLLNSYILAYWKVLVKGKFFWLRSAGASVFSEAFYSLFAIFMMEVKSIPFYDIFSIVMLSFSIKVVFSLAFSIPGQMFVNKIKSVTKVDIYDLKEDFSPLKFFGTGGKND